LSKSNKYVKTEFGNKSFRGIILLILLLVNSYSLGQDLVVEYGKPLLIKEDTTWSGEILIQDFVDVAPGATLTIAPRNYGDLRRT